MTLARITERIEEKKIKDMKIDGRRFSKRSQKKIKYEVRDLQKKAERRTGGRKNRGGFTKEELEEYKRIDQENVARQRADREIKSILNEILDKIC